MLNLLRAHAKQLAVGLLVATAVGSSAFAYYQRTQSCCYPGASCCYPGSPCCAGHDHSVASR